MNKPEDFLTPAEQQAIANINEALDFDADPGLWADRGEVDVPTVVNAVARLSKELADTSNEAAAARSTTTGEAAAEPDLLVAVFAAVEEWEAARSGFLDSEDRSELREYLAGAINNLPAAAPAVGEAAGPGWVSVKERLPEAEPGYWSESVLTINNAGNCGVRPYYNAQNSKGWWLDEITYDSDGWRVTHWMPLPTAPIATADE